MRSFAKTFAKQIFRIVDPTRYYDRSYREVRAKLDSLKINSKDELERLERSLLTDLFERIFTDVPFYQQLDAFSRNWRKNDPVELLHQLPLITKSMIQEDVESFTSQSIPKRRLMYVSTGGSTALPFGFYNAGRVSDSIETAYLHYIWSGVGYRSTSRSAIFRGTVVSEPGNDRLWKYDPFQRAMIYSSYHLRGDDLARIFDHLLRFNPSYIQAYPSAADVLAAHIEETKANTPTGLKAILLASENLPLWQRERIERAFGVPVYSWYGHAERAILAPEFPGSTDLHVLPTYGFAYLRADDGSIVTNPGVPGEIIATGFTCQGTQFVNYRTGDIGIWADRPDVTARVFERVEGRVQELAVTATGRKISMTAINMHSDIFEQVKQFRFVQDEKGMIRMEIVRKSDYSDVDEREINRGVTEKFGDDMKLEIAYVDSIPLAKSGKARFLIQNLEMDNQN